MSKTYFATKIVSISRRQYLKALVSRWSTTLLMGSSLLFTCVFYAHAEQNPSFREAKINMVEIFRQMKKPTTIYCGCPIEFPKSGGYMVNLYKCGYVTRGNTERAGRIEAEHIMPAHRFGGKRECWITGRRQNCKDNDPYYLKMEADLHNLYPAVGEVNADRNNYHFVEKINLKKISNAKNIYSNLILGYGKCDILIDPTHHLVVPPAHSRGIIARAYLYMSRTYEIALTDDEQKRFEKWDREYPPTPNECLRNRRITIIQGHDNPFVTKWCH